MQRHRRFPQPQDLERLAEEAKRLGEEAELLPSGALREQVLLKARHAQRESHMIKWLSSSGLQALEVRPPRLSNLS